MEAISGEIRETDNPVRIIALAQAIETMGTALNNNIVNSYLALFKSLSPRAKLDLISRLTQSLEGDLKPGNSLFDSAFGAWQGDESAEQLISDIRDSRNFNRQIEGL